MKCGAGENSTCIARQGDECMEQFLTDTPSCKSRVPFTNGDHIRVMPDEELATFLKEVIKRAQICQVARIDDSELCSLDWLKQPAPISWHHENGMSARGHENIEEVSQ